MSIASSEETAAASAAVPNQVDLSQLDDKHLSQYRHRNERWAITAIAIGLSAIVIILWLAREHLGNILSFLPSPVLRSLLEWIHPTRVWVVLFVLLGLVWIVDIVAQTIRSWQLVAQAVEVTPATYPQLAPVVDEIRARFDLPKTRVFISRAAPPPGYTVGVREPYYIVFSSVWVGGLSGDEFKFGLGREVGHIKLGHQLASALLGSAKISLPQPFSLLLKFRSVLFGSYQHAQELSADRIGVVATRDVRPALSSLIKQSLGNARGAKLDMATLAPQTAEAHTGFSGKSMRIAQLLNPEPFAMTRLQELVAWAGEPVDPPAEEKPAPAASQPGAAAAAPARSDATPVVGATAPSETSAVPAKTAPSKAPGETADPPASAPSAPAAVPAESAPPAPSPERPSA